MASNTRNGLKNTNELSAAFDKSIDCQSNPQRGEIAMAFAVIDFETTGLVPERNDRVIEVGIVLVDAAGNIEHDWTTLVNPHRDIGATHIHRLRAADVIDAPEFDAIADAILDRVAGRTLVAHNATFDMRFLQAELTRAGYEIRMRPPALCSMKWAGRLVGPAKLAHACEAIGISLTDAHSALADAHATAGLLKHLMGRARGQREWNDDTEFSRSFSWPVSLGRPLARTVARGEREVDRKDWLDDVLGAAWIPGVPEDEASYMLVLERALLDRQVSRTEARQLVEVATKSKLSGATVARLHYDYLCAVAREALADGALSESERLDLLAVANALDFNETHIAAALTWANERRSTGHVGKSFVLAPGDRIVFTGETCRPRDEWVNRIIAAGLVSGGVTKSTKLVVAADPDTLSGKAAKARDYRIPIVDEVAFARLFDDYCANR